MCSCRDAERAGDAAQRELRSAERPPLADVRASLPAQRGRGGVPALSRAQAATTGETRWYNHF